VRPKPHRFDRFATFGNPKLERVARIKVPDLSRVDAVPVRALAALQQEVDGGRARPAVRPVGVAKRLAKMSTLGMRLQSEQADDLLR